MISDVLAGIGTILLNKPMGTTGRTQNVANSRHEVANILDFCMRYFPSVPSTNRAKQFGRVWSRNFLLFG
jgi:hypothetical protein